MDDQKSERKGFTKYVFGDKIELLAILVDPSNHNQVIAVKDERIPYFKIFAPKFRRYVEGSTPNKNWLKKSCPPSASTYLMTNPPQVGEHLIISYLYGFRNELTDLVVTEIIENVKPSLELIKGAYKKYHF